MKIENVARDPQVLSSFFDNETTLQAASAGGTGLPTASMKQSSTFTDWDFSNIWVIDEGNDYPRFQLDPTGFEDDEEDIPEDNPVVPTEPPLGDDNPPIIAPEDPDGGDGDEGGDDVTGETPVDETPVEINGDEPETPVEETPDEIDETPDDGDLVDHCINNLGKLVNLHGFFKVNRRTKDSEIGQNVNFDDFDLDDKFIDQGERDKRKRRRRKRARSRNNSGQTK